MRKVFKTECNHVLRIPTTYTPAERANRPHSEKLVWIEERCIISGTHNLNAEGKTIHQTTSKKEWT